MRTYFSSLDVDLPDTTEMKAMTRCIVFCIILGWLVFLRYPDPHIHKSGRDVHAMPIEMISEQHSITPPAHRRIGFNATFSYL